jgi:hypothetical protein
MKQLYCVSNEAGQRVDQHGVRVTAASSHLPPEHLQSALRYAGSAAPAGASGEAVPPVRLALLQTPDAGRILCHTTCLRDPITGKNGQYFAHLLLDVPAALDAHQAIQSWGSDLWQRTDPGGGAELPDALYLPVASALGDAQLADFLDRPRHHELMIFLLGALLSTPPTTRLFIVAPSEEVALCVYGITRALPLQLLEQFTFSTYERDPLACPARLIGTCWDETTSKDLPNACYEGQGVAFNLFSGRHTELPSSVPFAEFAVEALAKNQTAALDEFHATWQRLGVREAGLFDLVYRMARGTGVCSKEESQQLLQHPTLGAWVASRSDALGQFLEWALDDHTYATTTFSRAVASLRQKPDRLTRLAHIVEERGLAALREGNLVRTRNCLEAILPMVAPARASSIWSEILVPLKDPDTLSWEVRCYLLPRLVRIKPAASAQALPTDLERWLRVPTERLGQLLALDLPHTCQVAVYLVALQSDGAPTPELARVLARYPTLLMTAVQHLASQSTTEAKAVTVFNAVLAEAPAHPWVEDLVRLGHTLPGTVLDRCLEFALQTGRVNVLSLARGQGPALLELLAGKPSLNAIAVQLMSQPASALLADQAIVEFLKGLTSVEGLSAEVKVRLDACLGMAAFLRQPSLESETLTRVTTALKLEPPLFPPEVFGQVVNGIAAALSARSGQPSIQADLENVLLILGPNAPAGPSGLYRDLLHSQQTHKHFWKQADLLHAYLAVALGAPQAPALGQQLDNLDAEAYGLAREVGKWGGKRVLAALDQYAKAWPRASQTQWTFLAKAVQPRGARGLVRDAGLFLSGLTAGSVGAAVLHWLGFF